MGQGISSLRDSDAFHRRRSRRTERRAATDDALDNSGRLQEEVEQSLLRASPAAHSRHRDGSRLSAPVATFRRQISARSTALRRPSDTAEREHTSQDEVVYEHEERPLMSVEDIRIGDAPITHITASPMPRSPSVIARIGTRLSQRYSVIEPGAPELHEPLDEWQNRWSTDRRSRRHSMFESFAGTFLTSHHIRGRRRLAPISRPMPVQDADQYELIRQAGPAPVPRPIPSGRDQAQRSRLSRVRRSISGPLEALLGSSSNRLADRPPTPYYSTEPNTAPSLPTADTDYLLPPINVTSTPLSFGDQPSEPGDEARTRADTPIPNASQRSSWTERWTNRSSTIRRESRRVPNLLRGRSSRLIRRDDEAPLSRILQLAAAAIAAQLSGSTDALANLEPVGDEHFDGGLNHFVEDLNNAAGSVQASHDNPSSVTAGAASLNFWRAFRFVGPSAQRSAGSSEEGSDPRTVTLVVVGVRSVPSSTLQDGTRENPDPGLDSILDMPPLSNGVPSSRPSRSTSLLRSLNGRSRLASRAHRSSMSDVETLLPRSGLQQAGQAMRPRSTIVPRHTTFGSMASHDSPPGPRPPPTTPAELSHPSPLSSSPPDLSRSQSTSSRSVFVSDEPTSESMTSVSESANNSSRLSRRDTRASRRSTHAAASALASNMNHDLMPDGDNIPSIPDNVQVRQRRRSDSEQARSRNLASHRNGTIDPDGGPTQRSWLIYVVGTNLPENHPAFLTPSLFSDNPTYEDLVNLQNLIGVVKPRVAEEDDVANAGGVYTLTTALGEGNLLIATSVETGERLMVPLSDACIVCLEPYVAEQQIRQLSKCSHVFHPAHYAEERALRRRQRKLQAEPESTWPRRRVAWLYDPERGVASTSGYVFYYLLFDFRRDVWEGVLSESGNVYRRQKAVYGKDHGHAIEEHFTRVMPTN